MRIYAKRGNFFLKTGSLVYAWLCTLISIGGPSLALIKNMCTKNVASLIKKCVDPTQICNPETFLSIISYFEKAAKKV